VLRSISARGLDTAFRLYGKHAPLCRWACESGSVAVRGGVRVLLRRQWGLGGCCLSTPAAPPPTGGTCSQLCSRAA
jgi:hypothetical protein